MQGSSYFRDVHTLGKWRGVEWRAKVRVKNGGWAQVKPKNQPGKGCAGESGAGVSSPTSSFLFARYPSVGWSWLHH